MTVVVTEQEQLLRAAEAFLRAAAGLAMDGLLVSLTLGPIPDEERSEEEGGG